MTQKITPTAIKETDNIVLLITPQTDLATLPLSEAEQNYVSTKMEQKATLITLNRFTQWILLAAPKPAKTENQFLENCRLVGNDIVAFTKSEKIESLSLSGEKEGLTALAEGILLGNYQFLKYQTQTEDKKNPLQTLALDETICTTAECNELEVIADAVTKARNLVNEPLSYLTAERLAEKFIAMGKEASFPVEIFHKQKIESLKMGGLLAVNKGSIDPPTFSILEYKPDNAVNEKPLVLVGKGVVYDTGGLSLKPTAGSMDFMKSDMAGGATVGCALYAAAKAKLPVHVIALIPATDNRPDGNAYAPGDVITMYSGKTVEVLNTDAEGRLLLADALCYAKKYDPALVIDVATLTGSAVMAIGTQGIVGMGTADEQTKNALKTAGNLVHERVVEFPLWDEYGEGLKSSIADITNLGPREAGSITAGKFLEHFIDYPWMHLDIAGPSYLQKPESYRGKGGSGTGVRLLFNFMKNFKG